MKFDSCLICFDAFMCCVICCWLCTVLCGFLFCLTCFHFRTFFPLPAWKGPGGTHVFVLQEYGFTLPKAWMSGNLRRWLATYNSLERKDQFHLGGLTSDCNLGHQTLTNFAGRPSAYLRALQEVLHEVCQMPTKYPSCCALSMFEHLSRSRLSERSTGGFAKIPLKRLLHCHECRKKGGGNLSNKWAPIFL